MRLNNIVIRLYKTGRVFWYGPNTTEMDEYHTRTSNGDMDAPVALYTGIPQLYRGRAAMSNSQITVQH